MSKYFSQSQKKKGLGLRIFRLRHRRCLHQEHLAQLAGLSQRVISYYESRNRFAPGEVLVKLATSLQVSVDQLLGVKRIKQLRDPLHISPALQQRLERISRLPYHDRMTVMRVIDLALRKV